MPVHGNFDDIIKQSLRPTKHSRLKELEEQMEAPPWYLRPKVQMEPGSREMDYPYTNKYNYVRPGPQRPLSPRSKEMILRQQNELGPLKKKRRET